MPALLPAEKTQQLKKTSRIVQGIFYMLAALPHFVAVDTELKLIPPFLPWRRAALYITGIFEFLGGLGLLVPHLRKPASWGLAALLIAIWPANIYHAILDKQSGRWPKTRIYHIIRFPLQIVLIAWVLWAGKDEHSVE